MKDIFTLYVGRNFRCSQHLVKFVLYNTTPDTTDAARGQVYVLLIWIFNLYFNVVVYSCCLRILAL